MRTISAEFICPEVPTGVSAFISDNAGLMAEISVKVIADRVKYFQHKHLNGNLIPAIADISYSGDRFECTVELKKRFLLVNVDSYSEIPQRHRNGQTMFVFNNDQIVGYIPSRANLTKKEMEDFIKRVEDLYFEITSWVS